MFCGKCGEQLAEDTKFCGKCGVSNQSSANGISKTEVSPAVPAHQASPVFYSEDWSQRKVVIAAVPYFDVMADREYLYLIKLGQYYWSTLGLIVGLVVLNILGAIIGYYMGNANDKKKRNLVRSLWLDANRQVISRAYENYLFLKIPLKQVIGCVTFEKHKMTITYNNQKMIFAKKVEEVDRLNKFIKDYVL